MKKALFYLLLFIVIGSKAQTNPITAINISLPANPDANMANWGTGASTLTITANGKAINGRVDGFVQESKILIIIKKGGSKICGAYTSSTAPASNFNTLTKVWSGSNVVSLIGQNCILQPGEYELSVQFFGYSSGRTIAFSEEKTKTFTIRGNEQQSFQAPQAIAPINGLIIKESDVAKPITFRWTPLIPRPQEPTTYRLRVWQLMQGQNGTQARTTNQPILTKDVDNLTQAVVTNLYTGPCKTPYLCDFVWNIQALNRDGKPIGGNNGTSETFAFGFKAPNANQDLTVKLLSPTNGETTTLFPLLKAVVTHPTDAGVVGFKIKIVEIVGDQSPEQAFRTNKPHFEKDSLNWIRTNKPIFEKDSFPPEIRVPYPLTAPLLKVGKKYAWAIVLDGAGKTKQSDVFMFTAGNCDVNLSLKLRSVECLPDLGRVKRYKINFSSTYSSSTYNLTYTQSGSGLTAYHPSYSPNYTITNISPTLQTQNSGAGSTVNYSVEVSVPIGQTAIKLGLQGDDKDPGPVTCKPGAELDITLPVCTVSPCDCGTWGKLNVSTNPTARPVPYDCGSRITWKCNQPLTFSTNYTCSTKDTSCVAKLRWEIKKDGVTVKTGYGTNSISDSFRPTSNGIYILTLNANCGDKSCTPCTYTIIVEDCKPPVECDCGKWGPLVYEGKRYECGSRIIGSCKKPFQFTSSYQCATKDTACVAKTTWEVKKGGVLIKSGTGTNTLSDGVSLMENGVYTLTLNANCGDKKCEPCTYSIVVEDCKPDVACDCGTWSTIKVQTAAGEKPYECGTTIEWNCKVPFNSTALYACNPNAGDCLAKTNWEVRLGNTIIQTGSGSGNAAFTPMVNGEYQVTLNAVCKGLKCKPCIYTVIVTNCKPSTDGPKPGIQNEEEKENKDKADTIAYYYDLEQNPSFTDTEIFVNPLPVQFYNDYATSENLLFSIYDPANKKNVLSKTKNQEKLKSITGLNRLSIDLDAYKLEPGKAYLLTVSDLKTNYQLNFKLASKRDK